MKHYIRKEMLTSDTTSFLVSNVGQFPEPRAKHQSSRFFYAAFLNKTMTSKNIILNLLILSLLVSSLHAQVTTARSVAVASGMAGNVYYVVGQTFASQWGDDYVEISEGVAQAQIYNIVLEADTCEGEGYAGYGYYYPADTLPGTYSEQRYVHSTTIGYDTILVFNLTIHPVYNSYDTLTFYTHYYNVIPWQEGDNFVHGTTELGCDSNRHVCVILRKFGCGDTIADFENNMYSTVEVGGLCWTKENIRSKYYSDGTQIATGLVYSSSTAPDTAANLMLYGRLYTWQSAVRVPENSLVAPVVDNNGNVAGVCPYGWHLPSLVEMNVWTAYAADSLKSTTLWLIPGTNALGLTIIPAGHYNPITNRFEELLGKTHFWTSDYDDSYLSTAIQIRYSCEYPFAEIAPKNVAYSVRCVKDDYHALY